MEVVGQAKTVNSAHKPLGVVVVELVDDAAHAHIGAHLQRPGQGDLSVTAMRPVVVFHLASIHVPHAIAGLYHHRGVADAIIQGHENTGRFEHRSGFEQVAHGMVLDLSVFSINTFFHVDNGLHVARRHFHDDGHTHIGVDFLQFLDHRPLSQILNADVDGGDDVGAINGRCVHDA